jgi:hypothetical protein
MAVIGFEVAIETAGHDHAVGSKLPDAVFLDLWLV